MVGLIVRQADIQDRYGAPSFWPPATAFFAGGGHPGGYAGGKLAEVLVLPGEWSEEVVNGHAPPKARLSLGLGAWIPIAGAGLVMRRPAAAQGKRANYEFDFNNCQASKEKVVAGILQNGSDRVGKAKKLNA